MIATVEKALALWAMDGASSRLIAARENQVFRVDHAGASYALRLHRAGYRTLPELRSELLWMEAMASGGIGVPKPIASTLKVFLHEVDGIYADMLTWLPGMPMGSTGEKLTIADRPSLFRHIGRQMARMHETSDAWQLPEGFVRRAWDRQGLVGETPFWGPFWENPTLNKADKALFEQVREVGNAQLSKLENELDYGLIHADLVRENIMIDGDQLYFIDFDDSGFGFRLFDLATTLVKNLDEQDHGVLKQSLLDGYQSVRALDTVALDLFILLRSATYVGWIVPRMDEEGAVIRNERFVRTTRRLAEEFLQTRA